MTSLTELKALTSAAAIEAEGDWFDPALLGDGVLISSSRKAKRYIAAATPETLLALLAVVDAAPEALEALERARDWLPTGGTRECVDGAIINLRAAIAAQEAIRPAQEGDDR